MCGIAGVVARDLSAVSPESREDLFEAVRFRGRDDQGTWTDNQHVFFSHSRLAIIDLATGSQPMQDGSGRFVIVHNGEIYNYYELRGELESAGARFLTQSDTEIILEGFRIYGARFFERMNGMFAFAIWDKKEREITLARDRLGKKPLYYFQKGSLFGFSSSLRSFRSLPGWEPKLSLPALAFFSHQGGFPRGKTIYEFGHSLPGGSWAQLSTTSMKLKIETYWSIDFKPGKTKAAEDPLLEEYGSILTDATKIRLRSDVPLALSFSGGVDSGTIASICAKRLNFFPTCFTIDYDTESDRSEEVAIASRVARYLGLDWKFIQFDYHSNLLPQLRASYAYFDQPCHQLALVYSQRLYEQIKPFATVVISGNGCDEMFTGYNGDERSRQLDILLAGMNVTPTILRKWLQKSLEFLGQKTNNPWLLKPASYLYPSVPQGFKNDLSRSPMPFSMSRTVKGELDFLINGFVEELIDAGVKNTLDLRMYKALTCGAVDANFRVPDISGLAAQIEVRSPYLDFRMVEFASRLPHRYKIKNPLNHRTNKYLPKRYYERLVPKELAWASKKGMGANLKWDVSIVKDENFRQAFEESYDEIDRAELDSTPYRHAWRSYCQKPPTPGQYSPYAGLMVNGFMLGKWLSVWTEDSVLNKNIRASGAT